MWFSNKAVAETGCVEYRKWGSGYTVKATCIGEKSDYGDERYVGEVGKDFSKFAVSIKSPKKHREEEVKLWSDIARCMGVVPQFDNEK